MADRLLPEGATESWLEHGDGRIRVLRAVPRTAIRGRRAAGPPDPRRRVRQRGHLLGKVFGPLASDRLVIAPDLPGFGYTEGIPVTGGSMTWPTW